MMRTVLTKEQIGKILVRARKAALNAKHSTSEHIDIIYRCKDLGDDPPIQFYRTGRVIICVVPFAAGVAICAPEDTKKDWDTSLGQRLALRRAFDSYFGRDTGPGATHYYSPRLPVWQRANRVMSSVRASQDPAYPTVPPDVRAVLPDYGRSSKGEEEEEERCLSGSECNFPGDCCDEMDNGYICTRPPKHRGSHIACGGDHNLHIWRTSHAEETQAR